MWFCFSGKRKNSVLLLNIQKKSFVIMMLKYDNITLCCLFYLSCWGCFCGRIWGVFSQLMGMAAKNVLQLSWGHFHCRTKVWIWMKIYRFEVLNRHVQRILLSSTCLIDSRENFHFQEDTANSTAVMLSRFKFSPGKLNVWVLKYPLSTPFHPSCPTLCILLYICVVFPLMKVAPLY